MIVGVCLLVCKKTMQNKDNSNDLLSLLFILDSSPTTLALKFEDVHNSNDDDLPANEQNEYV